MYVCLTAYKLLVFRCRLWLSLISLGVPATLLLNTLFMCALSQP